MALIVNDLIIDQIINACLFTKHFHLLQFTILISRPNNFINNDNVPCLQTPVPKIPE